MKQLCKVALVASLMMSCGPAVADGFDLAGSEWGLDATDGRFVQFAAGGKLSGNAGCNRFFGSYTLEGDRLRIGPLGMTRKMCAPADMERERQFTGLLARVRRFEASHLRLTLYGAKRVKLAVLKRRDFD